MGFSSAKFMVPAALAALVGIAGLSPVPNADLIAEAQAQGLPPQGPGARLLSIAGRGYAARASLTVVLPGAAIEGQDPQFSMNCNLRLQTLDGQAIGPLPGRVSMWVRSGRQVRLVTLNLVPSSSMDQPNTAQYFGSTRAILQAGPLVDEWPTANVQIQWREGRRIRFAEFPRVPIETLALP